MSEEVMGQCPDCGHQPGDEAQNPWYRVGLAEGRAEIAKIQRDRYRQALLLVQSSRYSTALSSFAIPAETMREVDRALAEGDDPK